MILNSVFEDKVVINTDEEFVGCEFVSGTTPKEKGVFGLEIKGDAKAVISDCKFANKGYSAIYLNTTGKVDIEKCTFECAGLYNPIEGTSGKGATAITEVNIKGNIFKGICGNNYMNFYNVAEDAVVNIEDNMIDGMSQQSECLRLSNTANNNATFNIKNLKYAYNMNTEFDAEWTKMILCQDYTGDQDFGKYTLNIQEIECNGITVKDAESFPVGGLICYYLTETKPVINF